MYTTMQAVPSGSGEMTLGEAAVDDLRSRFRGELIRPEDTGYDVARAVWNGMIDRRPALVARCSGVADVIEAVRFARAHELLVAVRGGGHNGAGTAVCDGGLVIDLSRMKGIRVDPLRRRVRAQSGVTWGELDRETQLFGMAVTGGIVSTTGIAGLTLNGGLSWQRRKYGMSIDNLLSADVVTADGRMLVASDTENADLFWAIRGGGGNFGVVTSFEYQMHRIGPEVAFAAALYPVEVLETVLGRWRDYALHVPDEITTDAFIWSVPAAPQFPSELHGRAVVGLAGMYAGPVAEGMRLLHRLRELERPVLLDMSGVMPYCAVQTLFDPFFPAGSQRYYWKSLYLNGLDAEVVRTMGVWLRRCPSKRTRLSIRALGGELARVPFDATAFGERDSPFLLSIDSTWTDPTDDEENIMWTRAFWAAMRCFSSGQTYFNFAGLLEDEEAVVPASYGANYERLRILKTKYDPENVFRVTQNICPL